MLRKCWTQWIKIVSSSPPRSRVAEMSLWLKKTSTPMLSDRLFGAMVVVEKEEDSWLSLLLYNVSARGLSACRPWLFIHYSSQDKLMIVLLLVSGIQISTVTLKTTATQDRSFIQRSPIQSFKYSYKPYCSGLVA